MKKTSFITAIFITLYFGGLLFIQSQGVSHTLVGVLQELMTLPLLVILVLLLVFSLRKMYQNAWKIDLYAGSFLLCLATAAVLIYHTV